MLQTHLQSRLWTLPQLTPAAKLTGGLALVTVIFSSATYNLFAKQLGTVLSPLSLVFLSEILTGMFVLLSFGVFPLWKQLRKVKRHQLLALLLLGLLNGALAPLLWFTGLQLTTAVNAELFARNEMLCLVLFAVIFLGERLRPGQIVAGSAILFGILLVALHGFSEGIAFSLGDVLILTATTVFAVGSIVFKKFLHRVPTELIIVARATTAVATFFFLSPFIEHTFIKDLHAFPLALFPALIGFGFVSRFLNLFAFYVTIERLPVTFASLCMTMGIVVGIAFAALFLGESIEWYHLLGGSFITGGVIGMQLIGVHRTPKLLEAHIRQHHRHHL